MDAPNNASTFSRFYMKKEHLRAHRNLVECGDILTSKIWQLILRENACQTKWYHIKSSQDHPSAHFDRIRKVLVAQAQVCTVNYYYSTTVYAQQLSSSDKLM